MKKLSHSFKLLMITMLFVTITLAVADTANAEWYCTHGHSGQIQNESVLKSIGHMGWGLDCSFNNGNRATWIHFAVPSLKGYSATRFIRLKYYTRLCEVMEIHVWNGNEKKKYMEVGPDWSTDGWHEKEVDLGPPIDSTLGVGISVKVRSKADPEYTKNRFIFSSASANFF